ncbi:hypothetical protein [Bacillus thuringiensis]|nr:hypothetical protein [Bacillus thuringiensis]KIP25693.1 N-acetylmuramic acid 6-phosphate etherase domain protein [Bacillus thuringiensis serovar morrisoni]MED2077227.1 hypothetical protein [Bacillus thuringiensis]
MNTKQRKKADNNSKVAIVMILTGFSKEEAMQRLEETQGFIRQAIK